MSIYVRIIKGPAEFSEYPLPVDEAAELSRQGIAIILGEDYLDTLEDNKQASTPEKEIIYTEYTVKELKEILAQRGLDVKGNKKTLIQRLEEHDGM